MDFRQENLITVDAHQNNPHGPMIEPIDTSLLGNPSAVHIEKTNAKTKKE